MSARDELARIIMSPESLDGGPPSCGPGSVYAARIADALTAAGFGDVREAKAQAFEEAANAIDKQRDDSNPERTPDEGWSVVDHRAGRFLGKVVAARYLRARAAAVRGEG